MEKVKTLFFGSGKFAVPILKSLTTNEFIQLTGVVTQPDRPAGRAKQLKAVPVKTFLADNGLSLPIFQPQVLKHDADLILEQTMPELVIVADYGQILPEKIINYPRFKCLNVHGSILPDMRGAVPIPMAILKGYKQTGISILVMTPGLDDGPLIYTAVLNIENSDTTASLTEKLSLLGAEALSAVMPEWLAAKITPQPQDESKATFAGKELISKKAAEIKPEMTAEIVERMVRAFFPWPIAWIKLELNGKERRLKLFKVSLINISEKHAGRAFKKINKQLVLELKSGSLLLEDIQLDGMKRNSGKDYLFLTEANVRI